ncbi:maleylpyruvate isomerase family mycothiol-dependent enzyme [Dermatophilaceae bacterium Soc4.6]
MSTSPPQSSTADAVIDALAAGADELVPVAEGLTAQQLRAHTRPGEWSSAAVLSHLGSGAVIALAGLEAALTGEAYAGFAGNQPVWDEWNAMEPEEQRDGFVEANATLQSRYAAIDPDTRRTLRVDLGFLPAPVDLATAACFRLNELALHSWDLRVARDPEAQVQQDAVPLLLESLLPMMVGWLGKGERHAGPAVSLAVSLVDPEGELGLEIAPGGVTLGVVPEAPDGVLTIPAEAFLRLLTGRLDAAHTPAGIGVIGPVDLDALRAVFPGF